MRKSLLAFLMLVLVGCSGAEEDPVAEPEPVPATTRSDSSPNLSAVRVIIAEGFAGAEGCAVDASMIRADARRQHGVATSADLDPQRATRA